MSGVDRLVSVAIMRDGEVIKGFKSHWQLRLSINPNDPDPRVGDPGDVDGFMTSEGKFVDRDEARIIAMRAGQIHASWATAQRKLLSSDINW